MSVSYNIYRMPYKSLPELTKKSLKKGLSNKKLFYINLINSNFIFLIN